MNKFMQPISAEQLLAQSAADIDVIKTAAGFREVHFQRLCTPMLVTFANHVQLLPLADKAYYEERGAWQFGLTASVVALRYAETQLFFPAMESEERRKMEPQCRFAAFAAILGSVVAMHAQNAAITAGTKDNEEEYHPLVTPMSLHGWLKQYPDARFTWRTDAQALSSPACAAIASKFMPAGLLAHFDLRVSLMVFSAIAPQSTPNGLESTLSKVVRLSLSKVIERYLNKDAARYRAKEASGTDAASDGKAIADGLIAMTNPVERSNPLDPSTPARMPPAPAPAAPIDSVQSDGPSSETLLANANPVLREWFAALKSHERYPDLKNHLVTTERGTEVPISMLGFFGVNGPTIKKMMTDAGMVVDRSTDNRAIILQPSLNPLLLGG